MIAQNILSLRTHEGLTQEGLGEALGVSRQIVIPKKAREVFGLEPGSELLILGDESQGIALQRLADAEARLEAYGRAVNDLQKGIG